MAKIRWNGVGRRLALGYEWPGRGAVEEVDDPDAVATLLAQPGNQFEIVDEPDEADTPEPKKIRKLSLKQGKED